MAMVERAPGIGATADFKISQRDEVTGKDPSPSLHLTFDSSFRRGDLASVQNRSRCFQYGPCSADYLGPEYHEFVTPLIGRY